MESNRAGENQMSSVTNVDPPEEQSEAEYDYNAPINPKVKAAIETISRELNGGNRKQIANTIYETISRDHRTLQQAFWSSMLLAQIRYGENRYDARNESAVMLAMLVRKVAAEHNFDLGLPYI
jgi:hypothetical protein